MKCSNCNYESPEDFLYCPDCGQPGPLKPVDPIYYVPGMETPVQGQPMGQQPMGGQPMGQQPMGQQMGPQVTYTAQTGGGVPTSAGEVRYTPAPPVPPVPPVSNMDLYTRACNFFSESLFLVVCILFSVNVALSVFTLKFPIVTILLTIFFWVCYAKAKGGRLTPGNIKCISGTLFAAEIIKYVVAGLLVVAGIICAAFFSAIVRSGAIYDLIDMLPGSYFNYSYSGNYYEMMEAMLDFSGVMVMMVLIIVAAIIFVWGICGTRGLHIFTKSVYRSIETGTFEIKKKSRACGWLIVFAVFSGLSALGGLITVIGFLRNGAMCAAFIMLNILIRKYTKDVY